MKEDGTRYRYHILAALLALALLAGALAGCAGQQDKTPGAGRAESESAGLFETGAPAAPQAGSATAAGDDPNAATAADYTPGPQPGFEALPQDACFAIPGTDTGDTLLLRGGQPVEGDYWVTDAADGRAVAAVRCELVDADPWPQRRYSLYDLDGAFLLDCGEMRPSQAVGRWVFVGYGTAEFIDGHAVNMDTGEVRFEHYDLAGYLGSGAYALWSRGSMEQPVPDPAVLVNDALEVLRRFDGHSNARIGWTNGQEVPGWLVLTDFSSGFWHSALYSAETDTLLPGEFLSFVAGGEGPMGLFRTEEGTAVYDLASGERITAPEKEGLCHHYSIYTPQVRGYTLRDAAENSYYGNCLETEDEVISCLRIGCMPGGFFAEKQDGSILLLDETGRLVETLPARDRAEIYTAGYPQTCLVVYTDGEEWRLYNRSGVCAEGRAGHAGLSAISGERYELYLYQNGIRLSSLLDGEGNILLSGLNQLYATGMPGVWAVQKGFSAGLMDETGRWLWRQSIFTRFTDEEDELW